VNSVLPESAVLTEDTVLLEGTVLLEVAVRPENTALLEVAVLNDIHVEDYHLGQQMMLHSRCVIRNLHYNGA